MASPLATFSVVVYNGKVSIYVVINDLFFTLYFLSPNFLLFIYKEYKLPSSAIFGRSCKRLAEIQEYDLVTTVLKNIEQNGMVSAKEKDDILLAVVKVIAQQGQVRSVWKFRLSFYCFL